MTSITVLTSGQAGSDGTGTISGTVAPGGGVKPQAVIAIAVHNAVSTSQVSTMTYGGVTMQQFQTAADTATETLYVSLWLLTDFYGTMPTGSQTLQMTVSGAATKRLYYVALTSDEDGLEYLSNGSDNNDQANPSNAWSIPIDFWVAGVACLASGNTDANTSVANGAELSHANFSGNAQSASLIWSNTTVNGGTLTMGWTVGSDDCAAVYIALSALKRISGTVLDSEGGDPVEGAVIDILYEDSFNPDKAFAKGTYYQTAPVTDASGNWTALVHKGAVPFCMATYDDGMGNYFTTKVQHHMDTTPT